MSRRSVRQLVFLTMVVVLQAWSATTTFAVPPQYTIITLPSHRTQAWAYDINNNGHVAGTDVNATQPLLNPSAQPSIWRNETDGWQRLSPLSLNQTGDAFAINNAGAIVGNLNAGGQLPGESRTGRVPFIWTEANGMVALPIPAYPEIDCPPCPTTPCTDGNCWGQFTPEGQAVFFTCDDPYISITGEARGVNNSGLATGWYTFTRRGRGPGCICGPLGDCNVDYFTPRTGVVWNGSTITELGTLGGDATTPNAINDGNVVVGSSQLTPGNALSHPFRWQNGTMTDLGTLGGPSGEAHGINNAGFIVGQADNDSIPSQKRAFIWDPDVPFFVQDLGVLNPFTPESGAYAINTHNQVVGYSRVNVCTAPGSLTNCPHAIIWDSVNGLVDLNNQVTGTTIPIPVNQVNTGWLRLEYARGINDQGWIVGDGQARAPNPQSPTSITTQNLAFLLIPVTSCSGVLVGDSNCDTVRNGRDVTAFVTAVLDPIEYANRYPSCASDYICLNDVNLDQSVNASDVQGFVSLLVSP